MDHDPPTIFLASKVCRVNEEKTLNTYLRCVGELLIVEKVCEQGISKFPCVGVVESDLQITHLYSIPRGQRELSLTLLQCRLPRLAADCGTANFAWWSGLSKP